MKIQLCKFHLRLLPISSWSADLEPNSILNSIPTTCLKGTFTMLIAYLKSKTDKLWVQKFVWSPKFRPVEMANYSGLISFLLAKRRDVIGVSSVPRLPAARMNTTRFCGCKGYRSCKLCEDEYGIASQEVGQERADQFERTAVFCLACQNAFMGDRCNADSAAGRLCSSHEGEDPFLSMTFLLALLLALLQNPKLQGFRLIREFL